MNAGVSYFKLKILMVLMQMEIAHHNWDFDALKKSSYICL